MNNSNQCCSDLHQETEKEKKNTKKQDTQSTLISIKKLTFFRETAKYIKHKRTKSFLSTNS